MLPPGLMIMSNGDIYGPQRLRKPQADPAGYQRIGVYDKTLGKRKHHQISRLVCEAFNGPPPTPRHHAAHLNGDNSDNRASNLAWKTPSENDADKDVHGTRPDQRGERNHFAKLTAAQVREIRALLVRGDKQAAIAALYDVGRNAIWEIAHGRNWKDCT